MDGIYDQAPEDTIETLRSMIDRCADVLATGAEFLEISDCPEMAQLFRRTAKDARDHLVRDAV